MASSAIPLETYEKVQVLIRIGNRAVHEAQEENRRLGIPNVYSINGVLYWELPSGGCRRRDLGGCRDVHTGATRRRPPGHVPASKWRQSPSGVARRTDEAIAELGCAMP